MREILITKNEEGIRLNKFIKKIFPTMPDSLIYKLLRKKYFELNKKKAEGNEILKDSDRLSIFLGEETINKFSNPVEDHVGVDPRLTRSNIIYEDVHIIIFNKPTGLLSQGNDNSTESVNSILLSYVRNSKDKEDKKDTLTMDFTPSIVNRLDRNTEGLIIFAKTYIAAREISKMIKEERIEKHYKTIVNGIVEKDDEKLINYYKKDEKNNIAIIKDYDNSNLVSNNDYSVVKLIYKVIERKDDFTKLEINLITGKSHQIRAQLAHIGHPIICDKKYMDNATYEKNVKMFKRKSQDLCCYKIRFGKFENDILGYLSDKEFSI